MDVWQACTNWGLFLVFVAGCTFYYMPKGQSKKPTSPPALPKETKKESKKPARKPEQAKSGGPSYASVAAQSAPKDDVKETQNGNKKRKANVQAAAQTAIPQQEEKDDIDMSTRQFAASMQKAREGIQVKSTNNNEARVRTVKPKKSPADTPILSSGSSQAGDAEDDWSPVQSPAKAGGIDDMLEPVAAGPTSLRITASEKPIKEKTNKQSNKEVVETKKQRQNRKKAENARLDKQESNQNQKVRGEQQRRGAREARGEPAKNGIPIPAAPVQNPWAEDNAAREAHLPVQTNMAPNAQFLDTFDNESIKSNSSSNHGNSTAATSTTDASPSHWADEDMVRATAESEQDSAWEQVKPKKKRKDSNKENDGDTTPVAAPVTNGKAVAPKSKPATATKPAGFQALNDEYEQTADVDSNDPSAWAA